MTRLMLHALTSAATEADVSVPNHVRISCGALVALASEVLDDDQDFLSEPSRTIEVADYHNNLLSAYAANGGVIPISLGACFSGRSPLTTFVSERQDTYSALLSRLGSRQEYVVRVLKASEDEPAEGGDKPLTGRDFLRSKLGDRDQRRTRQVAQTATCRRLLDVARTWADELELAVKPPEDVVIDAAALVRPDRVSGLTSGLVELSEDASAAGLAIRMTGPCPPYTFASKLLEADGKHDA
ncbi:MAG: GvpL/GvpF family gas vesicle protein [Pseudomonadota bacterium]